jgi:hypothetical protein
VDDLLNGYAKTEQEEDLVGGGGGGQDEDGVRKRKAAGGGSFRRTSMDMRAKLSIVNAPNETVDPLIQ